MFAATIKWNYKAKDKSIMRRILFLITGLFISLCLYSHPWKPSHYVVVDTDGGVDDMKAITMLLASPDVRVLAITVSPGVLSADNAYLKVKSLLNSFYHEGLPVGINRSVNFKSNEYKTAMQYSWGSEENIDPQIASDAVTLIGEIFSVEKTKVSFICLGGLSTAWNAMNKLTVFREHVKEIIWSADGAEDKEGFNYQIDKNASARMLKQEISLKIIRGYNPVNENFYDEELLKSLRNIETPYAEKMSGFLISAEARNHKFAYSATDELIAVFLHYPDLFVNKVYGNVSDCTPADIKEIRDGVFRILKGETVSRNQVIRELPLAPDFYFDDIKPAVSEIVDKYGIDEWTSGVLANELHRHLGVFAIIGVKMGIRAREYFDTGVDEFAATSFAGSNPPLSCMNDGIQVSTGATPGHGLLTISQEVIKKATAEFTYMNRKIRLTLKPELEKMINAELKEINFIYGLDSDIYWELVRKNSIKYWKDLDRHEIFVIEEM